jgi:hypothetical protein
MAPLLASVVQFFKEDGWNFAQEADAPVLRVRFRGHSGQWGCFAQTREEQQQVAFYSVYPSQVPPDKRAALAETLTWINYDLVVGNFELSMREGHLRYKTSIDVEGDRLTPALVKQMVYDNVLTMDRYLPAIEAVLSGEATPEAAVARVESSPP